MKKIILLVVSLVFVASLFAGASGEAYMQYPLIGYAGAADEDGGLVQGYVGIGYWGADYGFHFNFRDTAYPGDNFTINHMFKKFKLHEYVNLLVGKTAVPLVKQNNPSGFANINIIETIGTPNLFNDGCWCFVNPMNDFMLKLDGNVKGLGWQLYTANINESNIGSWDYADYGLRLDYNVVGVDIGAGLMMVGVDEDDDALMNWAFDLGYTIFDKVKLDFQLVNYAEYDFSEELYYETPIYSVDDDTLLVETLFEETLPLQLDLNDMHFSIVAEYTPGLKGVKPYLGYYTYDIGQVVTSTPDETYNDLTYLDENGELTTTNELTNVETSASVEEVKENVIFFGLNFNPTENSVLKLEYKMFSQEDLDGTADDDDYLADTLTLQLGFSF